MIFKCAYSWSTRPSRKTLAMLAKITGYSIIEVDRWFRYERWYERMARWSVSQLVRIWDGNRLGDGVLRSYEVFKSAYLWSTRPGRKTLVMLGMITGYSIREVDRWFRHQRWYDKKVIMRKKF